MLLLILILVLPAACGSPGQHAPTVEPLSVAFDEGGHFVASSSRFDIELSAPLSANADAVSDIRAWLQERVDELVQAASDEPGPGYFDDHRYSLSSRWETARFLSCAARSTPGVRILPLF